MYRNTFILVTVLAIIASLLVGLNIGKKLQPPQTTLSTPTGIPSQTTVPVSMMDYTNTYCKISLSYPETMTRTEPATGSAKFVSDKETVIFVCQKDIPGIATNDENKETVKIGSISGTLYHTATPKDGTPIDVLLFTHPKTGMDVLVSGVGSAFNAIIHSLTLTP